MDARYIDAERKLAATLGWMDATYTGSVDGALMRAQGIPPGAKDRTSVPAWARSNDDCVDLMLEHDCYVRKEATSDGQPVMVARWSDKYGFVERIAVPISGHLDPAAAFRYAAVIGVTTKVEAESAARELDAMVSA